MQPVYINLFYGQSRPSLTVDGEPVRMRHVPRNPKKAIMVSNPDPDKRLAVQYEADELGCIEVGEALHLMKFYVLGWPVYTGSGQPPQDVEFHLPDKYKISKRELDRITNPHILGGLAGSIGVEAGQYDMETLRRKIAQHIDDPWSFFGIEPVRVAKIDLAKPPEGLVFPRPDLLFKKENCPWLEAVLANNPEYGRLMTDATLAELSYRSIEQGDVRVESLRKVGA